MCTATHLEDEGYVSVAMQTVLSIRPSGGGASFDEGLDLDSELALIAGALGPVVVFPYTRELVADLTRRAGRTPTTLPVLNMGRAFKVDPESLRWNPDAQKATPAKRGKTASKPNTSKTLKKTKPAT